MMMPKKIQPPMLPPEEILCWPTIAHARGTLPAAARAAARAARARLGLRVLLSAPVQLLLAAAGARYARRAAWQAGAARTVRRNLRRHACAGAGIRLARGASAPNAAPARGVRFLRAQPRRVRVLHACRRLLRVAEHLQPVRGVGVLELHVGHLR